MSVPDSILGALEIGLNRFLALDDEAMRSCARLEGKAIALHVREFDASAWLHPGIQGIRVTGTHEGAPDVRLSGSMASFVRLMWLRDEQAELLLKGEVQVEGDNELAREFAEILHRVHFDFEELLASQFGGVAGHGMGRILRDAFGFGRRAAGLLGRDTAEYLREETRDLVHRADIQKWMDDVDVFRDDVARLEARVHRLQAMREDGEAA